MRSLASKCASRHKDLHFFDIATSKSDLNPRCFDSCHFQMCFASQRRPLFRHRNFQSPPNPVCFVHFHFQTCFAPQRRAIVHLSCPDVSAPAALASLLFDPPDTNQSKNTVLRDFPTFSRTRIFYLLTLSLSDLLHLLSSPFCLSPCPSIVGSLTSKLPSTIAVSLAI